MAETAPAFCPGNFVSCAFSIFRFIAPPFLFIVPPCLYLAPIVPTGRVFGRYLEPFKAAEYKPFETVPGLCKRRRSGLTLVLLPQQAR